MTKTIDDLLWLVRYVMQAFGHMEERTDALDDRAINRARNQATKARAKSLERAKPVHPHTVGNSYTRGGRTAKFDMALKAAIAGDSRALKEFLLDAAGDNVDDKQAVESFLVSTFEMPEAMLLKLAVQIKELLKVTNEPSDQGLITNSEKRKAVEDRAMNMAEEHYRQYFDFVENTASTEPFDFRCKKGNEEVRVEVKGSTGKAAQVFVTAAEVKNAQSAGWRTDLFVVSSISIRRITNRIVAEGGTKRIIQSWSPTTAELVPMLFRCPVPD